jgi:hypothetical protein
MRIGTAHPPFGGCARKRVDYERARTRARGDWELSAKKRSDTEGAGDIRRSKKPQASERGGRRQRSGDLGRALRSVYDDTLRETVPDDFLNLLGKLS